MGSPGSHDESVDDVDPSGIFSGDDEEVALGEFADEPEELALGEFADEPEELALGEFADEPEELALEGDDDEQQEELALSSFGEEDSLMLGDYPKEAELRPNEESMLPPAEASSPQPSPPGSASSTTAATSPLETDFFRRGGGIPYRPSLGPTRDAKTPATEAELASLPLSAMRPIATMDMEGPSTATPDSVSPRQQPATTEAAPRRGPISGAVKASFPPPEPRAQDLDTDLQSSTAITFAVEPVENPNAPPVAQAPLIERLTEEVGEMLGLRLPGQRPQMAQDQQPPFALPPRYSWLANLGEGGQGSVELVADQDLGRTVALKTIHSHKRDKEELIELFRESRITGQLEHPHIMPIYDVGQLPDGRLYYTMPQLPGESLHHVLALRRRGNAEALKKWPLVPLLQVLERACQGVGYAHAHGVIHRDLKPANILLGKHGEVLVVDWGIARVQSSVDGASGRLWSRQGEERVERVRGSPPYMAPEQIKHPDHVSPAADVFCLGVILYEVLCRESPFPGASLDEVVEMLCHERPVPPRERAPSLRIPAQLEEICLRSLEKYPGHRYSNAGQLATELGDFLSGGKRQDAAAQRLREAESLRSRYRVLVRRKEDGWVDLDARRQAIGEEAPSQKHLQTQRLEEKVGSLERAADGVFSEAIWALHKALSDDPGNTEVQSVLGELYGDRYAEAEWLGAEREQAYFRAMLRQFDDGRWSRWLRSGAELLLETVPEDSPIALYRLEDRDGVLEPGELIAPDNHNSWQVAPGRYAIARLPSAASAPGSSTHDWYYPVTLDRGSKRHLLLDLRGEDSSGERFCFVPGGPAELGGDRRAAGASYRDRPQIEPFALARHPVTVGAYTRFLDWLDAHDPVEARIRSPLAQPSRGSADERRPITGISLNDALAYCDWLRGATGVVLRLPSAAEWEKAARGADGRAYPWGDQMGRDVCASLELGIPQGPPPQVGSFPKDRSPFGIEDCAGGVWEWTGTALADGRHIVMGGAIISEPEACRVASRRALTADTKLHFLGFRVLLELS